MTRIAIDPHGDLPADGEILMPKKDLSIGDPLPFDPPLIVEGPANEGRGTQIRSHDGSVGVLRSEIAHWEIVTDAECERLIAEYSGLKNSPKFKATR